MTPSRCGVVLKACHTEALAECIYAFDALANFDGLHGLLLLFNGHLRDDDVEDAVFDLGADLLLVDVLRQHHRLAEVFDRELVTQVAHLFLVLFLLALVLFDHLNDEVTFGVDAQLDVFLGEARDAEFKFVVVFRLHDVHAGR